MITSNTPSTSESLFGQVSGPPSFGRYISRRLSIFKRISSSFSKTTSETDSFSHIIIGSLSYDGTTALPRLRGTKYDCCLMLKRSGYLHGDTSGGITLLNDFPVSFEDANGVEKVVPKADTSPKAIESAIRKTILKATAGSRVLFYFGGHGEEMQKHRFSLSAENPPQVIIVGNGERVSGSKLRSWLITGANPGVSVTAVFDACSSAGILGLSYQYEYCSKGIQIEKSPIKRRQ
ncbi:hypothetical protein M407DRAFT_29767 [Tulasnella calospora MUT 4182]|uniref:Peptidase C14 caspase domain-containing protein n=1 Tax=Tulasnella calospora MUT 4182 TaxID=1051891 RepID=A0A0C3LGL5_9AGAM|nr:hypothetical protein M407DRAFT_29767 [Tulasnella calospora MUT 4182]